MTTKLHITNFGPLAVTVNNSGGSLHHIYPQGSLDIYVWGTEKIEITEIQPDAARDAENEKHDA